MDRKKAIALSFSVPVAWGFSYPLMKIGMDSMNATSIVALRCIIAFVACLLLFHKRAFRINRDLMVRAAIIGAIMALAPGVVITNFMRDIMAGDMLSGLSKFAEALLTGAGIALGTGLALSLARMLGGDA